MEEGDFIRIDYVGRISDSDEIFDLTKENLAKEKGIYNPKFKYVPIPVILGAHHVVKGLENELLNMDIGKSKKVIIKPEDALGKRKAELIRLIPLSEFKKRDINPFPGMPIIENEMRGKVLSVSGGRVRVDFNHPLAGKTLEYDVEIKEKINDVNEKIMAILELFLNFEKNEINIKIDKETLEIRIGKKQDVPKMIKKMIADNVMKWIKSVKKICFIEEFQPE
jgi:peptidylprolyl isomerase/FKBP-type peptidyl-prolyl cis-trans isomerase SlyD